MTRRHRTGQKHFRGIIINKVKYNSDAIVVQAKDTFSESAKVVDLTGPLHCVRPNSAYVHTHLIIISLDQRPDILNGHRIGQMINCDAGRIWIGSWGQARG